MMEYQTWQHVFKLDPNKEINDENLELICESGTDAVIVGGTDGVTIDNTLDLLMRIRRYSVPCVLEVSTIEALTPGFDYYFIPTVLNSNETKWVTGLHHEAVKEYGDIMNWDEIVMEGYCILNEKCKAAEVTKVNANLEVNDVVAYARMAEKMYNLPIFYLEYSGTYGDPAIVEKVNNTLTNTKLFYGGGIDSKESAKEMSRFADTIVVGNVIYEDLKAALATVTAVKQTNV
ncbi:geranylgeranylglyceryl/heptaprenylglyceryl phosphate synthase [Lottiidibacillus patelloidae]|uniref:Heptaprenylglyceryl phosphate synthase n=1 Tax=Lottiidibacillus patelloidae TaxID=2670334 RepID=A0A263BSZ3_9BACI|nr:heptaprenylglyceryl phosphate synthase [Lottiidibacillus patelloidae]OZM56825.1 geranylgeranylglyceryl/heptaprenylglyceryl phosphate synthase [Lottiidibacillus patelloidae]